MYQVDQASDLVNFRASPGDGQVLLEWDQLIDSDLTKYQYRHMSTADAAWNPDWTDIPDSNSGTTSFTATEPDQRHRIHLPSAARVHHQRPRPIRKPRQGKVYAPGRSWPRPPNSRQPPA